MQRIDNQTLELALFILVALAMVVQAIAVLGTFFVLRKTAKATTERLEELHVSVMPLIEKSHNLLTKVGPRIESTSEHVAAISQSLRAQTAEIHTATTDIVARAKTQAGRIDSQVTNLLDALDRAGVVLADCINKPIRQVNALLASLRAVVDSLRTSVPAARSQSNHAPGDGEMFL